MLKFGHHYFLKIVLISSKANSFIIIDIILIIILNKMDMNYRQYTHELHKLPTKDILPAQKKSLNKFEGIPQPKPQDPKNIFEGYKKNKKKK
tara:strand:- start:274 stop:549 length:276 start_codon:yes stop_codon:yes gene_type:complete